MTEPAPNPATDPVINPAPAFAIRPPDPAIVPAIRRVIDQKTKPLGALGTLEAVALRVATVQQTTTPVLRHPHVVVFAADHGLAEAGVSLYPQAVTYQMVRNFLNGGAAINVFCRQHGLDLTVVDAGVKLPPGGWDDLPTAPVNARVGNATRNCLTGPAMTAAECQRAIAHGADIVREIHAAGCNVIGLGEMGIGNTAAAALIVHRLTDLPLADCVGRGTGLDDTGLARKTATLQQVLARHPAATAPLDVLATFGGFEIAQLTGAMLQAAQCGMLLLVDGFIASAALLVAAQLHPATLDYCVFCHQSGERGHGHLLRHWGATPLLQLGLRLGEGTGAALAYPLVQSAVLFLNQMASFADAGVSQAAP